MQKPESSNSRNIKVGPESSTKKNEPESSNSRNTKFVQKAGTSSKKNDDPSTANDGGPKEEKKETKNPGLNCLKRKRRDKSIAQKCAQCASMEQTLLTKNEETENMKKQLKASSDKAEKLEADIKKLKVEIIKKDENHQNEMEKKREETKGYIANINRLNDELSESRSENSLLKNTSIEKNKETDELKGEIKNLKVKLRKQKQRHQNEMEKKREETDGYIANINRLNEELSVSRSENSLLGKRLIEKPEETEKKKVKLDDKNKYEPPKEEPPIEEPPIEEPPIEEPPIEEPEPTECPSTLTNTKLNCYLNSAIQAAASCCTFNRDMVSALEKLGLKENESLNNYKSFSRLLESLNDSNKSLDVTENEIFTNWNKPGEQDAFQLFSHAINEVFNEIRNALMKIDKKKAAKQAWLGYDLPMRMRFKYETFCNDCNMKQTNPVQTDIAIHVSIPVEGQDVLELCDLLRNNFGDEELDEFSCMNENCSATTARRRFRLTDSLPNIVCIHLQKSFWNQFAMQKIERLIKFDKTLVMRKEFSTNPSAVDCEFKLKSVIVHLGLAEEGHYQCYRLFKGQWFKMNDERVNRVNESDVLNCDPYVLFYERND